LIEYTIAYQIFKHTH